MTPDRAMTTAEAARRLRISTTAVRNLLASGQLASAGTIGRNLLIDADSVERLAAAGTRRGRPWTPATAWAALSLLSGHQPGWLLPRQLTRLRRTITTLDAATIHQLARAKDTTTRYRASPQAVAKLAAGLIPTGQAALADPHLAHRFNLPATKAPVEGYMLAGGGTEFAAALLMSPDPSGNAAIRQITLAEPFDLAGGTTPLAAVAVDLMDSLDPRTRNAGRRVLQELASSL